MAITAQQLLDEISQLDLNSPSSKAIQKLFSDMKKYLDNVAGRIKAQKIKDGEKNTSVGADDIGPFVASEFKLANPSPNHREIMDRLDQLLQNPNCELLSNALFHKKRAKATQTHMAGAYGYCFVTVYGLIDVTVKELKSQSMNASAKESIINEVKSQFIVDLDNAILELKTKQETIPQLPKDAPVNIEKDGFIDQYTAFTIATFRLQSIRNTLVETQTDENTPGLLKDSFYKARETFISLREDVHQHPGVGKWVSDSLKKLLAPLRALISKLPAVLKPEQNDNPPGISRLMQFEALREKPQSPAPENSKKLGLENKENILDNPGLNSSRPH